MTHLLKSIAFLLVFLFAANSAAISQNSNQTPIPINPELIKKTLPNGFTYYLQQSQQPAKQVHFQMVIKAGSILETEEQRGFAHFLEHMVFNGSKHFPNNTLIDYFQTVGVEFGADINAYTGYDETVYMLPLPNGNPEVLDKAFFFFGDILDGLTLSTEDIDSERKIILEEWRTTIGLNERLKKEMYPLLNYNSRYLHRMPIGLMEVVTKVGNDEELRKYHRSWYRPDLTSLLVVGDFDLADIEKRIADTFGKMKVAKDAPERVYYKMPEHNQALVKVIKDEEITSTSVRVVRKIPSLKTENLGDLKRGIADIIYTYMLNQRLTDIAQKANAPFMYASSFHQTGIGQRDRYTSYASVKADKILDGTKGLMRELYRVKQYGFTQEEFEQKKEILANDVKRIANEANKQETPQIMEALLSHVLYGEEYTSMEFKNEFVTKALAELTLNDIQALANTYISAANDNLVVIVNAPQSATTPTETEVLEAINQVANEKLTAYKTEIVTEPLMKEAPQAGVIVKETYNKEMGITTIEFANGASVALKPTTFKNDEIRFSSLRNGGYSLADDANFDNASMAATIVSGGGLGQFTPTQLDQITSGKQVYVAPYIHRYVDGVTGFSSKVDFETLLQLNYLIHTAPRKDKEQFNIFINNKKEYNKNQLNDADSYYADGINRAMMQNSPRTATLLTPEQLGKIDLDKCFEFYQSRFSSVYGTRFFIVGSFDVDSIKQQLAQYIGSLPGKEVATSYIDRGMRPAKGDKRFDYPRNTVDKTKVLMRFTGDYPASQQKRIEMNLLSDILTIRLNAKLREEIGGVYSPYSRATILQRPNDSYRMDIYFTCSPQNVDTLMNAALNEIEIMKQSINEADLDKVKKAWLKNRVGSLSTNGYWRKVMEDQWTRGETAKDFKNYDSQIQNVSAKDLKRLAKKYLIGDNLLRFILSPQPETKN